MQTPFVFFGRAWRNLNRRLSRLYLSLQVEPGSAKLERLGSRENGWFAPAVLPSGALCYCIGVGLDASFDFALAERGANVQAFDPTPGSAAYMDRENAGRVTFHEWGILDRDGEMRLYFPFSEEHGSHFSHDLHRTGKFYKVPCYRLKTVLARLGHPVPYLMKMDIEGSWYEVLPDMIRSDIRPDLLEVEYDSPAPLWRVAGVHRILSGAGYRLILRERDNAIYELSIP